MVALALQGGADSPDSHPPPGVVELREDLPLKAGGSGSRGASWGGPRCCAGGPRLILACFAALSAAITLALLTQIYYGDYEVVPHGSVSSSAAACSRAGTDALKAGGRAPDAAAAAALCLAVVAPHRTSLDASGSLLYWEYRKSRTQLPVLVEWGGAPVPAGAAADAGVDVKRPPRLVAALAALHAELGALPWPRLLQPAIDLARGGFPMSEGLAAALAAVASEGGEGGAGAPAPPAGSLSSAPLIAAYLETLQLNTSAELTAAWSSDKLVVRQTVPLSAAGEWRVAAGGSGAAPVLRALAAAAQPPPADVYEASRRVLGALQPEATSGEWPSGGVATGLAVVDPLDAYVALVTGVSVPFGSGPVTAAGWTRDEPTAPLDLAPAIMIADHVCGTRYVMGAESSCALAQVAAALVAGGGGGGGGGAGAGTVEAAVEAARVALRAGGALALEAGRPPPPPAALPAPAAAPALNATLPYAAVNLVQQRGDALLSHADSRGGGVASRF